MARCKGITVVCVCCQKRDDIAQLYFYRVYSCKDEGTIVRECIV